MLQMNKKNTIKKLPQLVYVRRDPAVFPAKLIPYINEEQIPSTVDTSETTPREIPSISLQQTNRKTRISSSEDPDTEKRTKPTVPVRTKTSLSSDNIKFKNQKELPEKSSQGWLKRLTLKQKIIFISSIVTFLLLGTAAAVVVPIYIYVIQQPEQESSFANITASVCSATTCIGQETPYRTSMTTALYTFDGSAADLTGYATGILFGSLSNGYGSACYVGTSSLYTNTASIQYIQIPYINFGQSFTLELWIYPFSLPVENGLFYQCDSDSKCLSISIRNSRIAVSFDSMNTTNSTFLSSSTLNINNWAHVAVVYDAILLQQMIYINGIIDSVSSGSVTPYAGTSSGSITTIGRSISFAYGTSNYLGRMDHLTISAGSVRTPCQIYNDATLLAYYPFNSVNTYNDYSVNLAHGMSFGTTLISHGNYGEAIYFSSNISYFQAMCFPFMLAAPLSFSISLWIKPDNTTTSGTIVHLSTLQNGNVTCFDLLAFSPSGTLIIQLMPTSTTINAIESAMLPRNIWTHVAIIYSGSNGLRVYINAQSTTTSITVSQGNNGITSPQFIILGNNSPLGQPASLNCFKGTVPFTSGPFKAATDEFRLYNRELNGQEICKLANL